MLKLTPAQQQTLQESGSGPLRMLDPRTGVVYLLIREADVEHSQQSTSALKRVRQVDKATGDVKEGFELKPQFAGIAEKRSDPLGEQSAWSFDFPDRSNLIAAPLSFQGRLTLTDVLDMARYRSLLMIGKPVRLLWKAFAAFLAALCLFGIAAGSPVTPLALIVFLLFILVFLIPYAARQNVKDRYLQFQENYLESRVILTQDRIYVENATHRSDYVWALIGVICATPEGLMFCDPTNAVRFWLPQRLFDGNDLRTQVLELAESNQVVIRWMD